jgi:hypothetical protein
MVCVLEFLAVELTERSMSPNDVIGNIYQESRMLVVPSILEEDLGMVMVEAGLRSMERAVIHNLADIEPKNR